MDPELKAASTEAEDDRPKLRAGLGTCIELLCAVCILPGIEYNDCNSEIAGVSTNWNVVSEFVCACLDFSCMCALFLTRPCSLLEPSELQCSSSTRLDSYQHKCEHRLCWYWARISGCPMLSMNRFANLIMSVLFFPTLRLAVRLLLRHRPSYLALLDLLYLNRLFFIATGEYLGTGATWMNMLILQCTVKHGTEALGVW